MKRISIALIFVALAASMTGCASKEELMHAEGRVDSTRILYTCNTLPQKQLAIQQFNACYMMAPKTEKNRKACEETARSLACDRLLDDGSNPSVSLTAN